MDSEAMSDSDSVTDVMWRRASCWVLMYDRYGDDRNFETHSKPMLADGIDACRSGGKTARSI
jgi:hypothetical protein